MQPKGAYDAQIDTAKKLIEQKEEESKVNNAALSIAILTKGAISIFAGPPFGPNEKEKAETARQLQAREAAENTANEASRRYLAALVARDRLRDVEIAAAIEAAILSAGAKAGFVPIEEAAKATALAQKAADDQRELSQMMRALQKARDQANAMRDAPIDKVNRFRPNPLSIIATLDAIAAKLGTYGLAANGIKLNFQTAAAVREVNHLERLNGVPLEQRSVIPGQFAPAVAFDRIWESFLGKVSPTYKGGENLEISGLAGTIAALAKLAPDKPLPTMLTGPDLADRVIDP